MKVSHYLKSLGNTAKEVAHSLRSEGIRGGDCPKGTQNPVVLAVLKNCKTWPFLRANGKRLTFDDCQIMDPVVPDAVKAFLAEYAAGKHQWTPPSKRFYMIGRDIALGR